MDGVWKVIPGEEWNSSALWKEDVWSHLPHCEQPVHNYYGLVIERRSVVKQSPFLHLDARIRSHVAVKPCKVQTKQHSYQRTATFSAANGRLTFRFMAGISMMLVIQTTPEFWGGHVKEYRRFPLLTQTSVESSACTHEPCDWRLTAYHVTPFLFTLPILWSSPLTQRREGTANI